MSDIPWSVIMDPQRLNDLRDLDILDTIPEQSYDDLAGIARMICETPVANVTLVAEKRQWFKSRIGNDAVETAIEQSVCAHAIAEENILVINDLTSDPRTRSNTLVTGDASLRFYAGVPLRLESSFGVGTLCVLDTKPHPAGLTPAQIDALTALGRQATILLQIRRYLAKQDRGGEGVAAAGDPLEQMSDALIMAYNINKTRKDEVLEKLLATGLAHVARLISGQEKSHRHFVH